MLESCLVRRQGDVDGEGGEQGKNRNRGPPTFRGWRRGKRGRKLRDSIDFSPRLERNIL